MNEEQEIQNILDQLKQVIDPEVMLNIVDLGLVYGINYSSEKKEILIECTLTSRGCPLGDVIIDSIEKTIQTAYPEHVIKVNIVWEPKWTIDRISEEGRTMLGY